ncbi:adenylyl-sulfate reductase subunit alpha [Bilifractor sp. LCP19S3_H10]|uniref:adenylyl-sulfate reductase subunit alpha n=1 Tax=Bilifractor sp. LCP19S3_H10 TaxID=3438736 RepID=UPI003F8FB256
MKIERINADVLIIGGGTAGCYAALTLADRNPELRVVIAEKANIRRSGCLAAGVNALNAYITKGHTPQFYVDYALKDAHGIAREDLLLTMSENLNEVTAKMERLGLVILKDENGEYVSRGNRNIKINGENFKPLLADAVRKLPNVSVYNNINIVDLLRDEKSGRVTGAFGHGVKEEVICFFSADATLIATGGASGIYRPNNPGFSRHKMWYSPFNTGAGYAMGIRAGAEMTTFEMRFIALRCKDTIAPTGTLAQGVGAKQINALGEVYENKYGLTTSQRVWGTVEENKEGRGPCYLRTKGISRSQTEDLEKAYLNMAPSQTLKWVARGKGPDEENVEIEGTEPYVVGGHTASGFWIDDGRRTTVPGLYAAGDVAGGCPQKYVTGALAEGKLAALSILRDLKTFRAKMKPCEEIRVTVGKDSHRTNESITKGSVREGSIPEGRDSINTVIHPAWDTLTDARIRSAVKEIESHYTDGQPTSGYTPEQLEADMQEVMDRYAGGISESYAFTEESLAEADRRIDGLMRRAGEIRVNRPMDLAHYFETRERLLVAKVLIAHLGARKETRWHCFAENESHPDRDDENWLKFVNSVYEDGRVRMIFHPIRTGIRDFTVGTGEEPEAGIEAEATEGTGWRQLFGEEAAR